MAWCDILKAEIRSLRYRREVDQPVFEAERFSPGEVNTGQVKNFGWRSKTKARHVRRVRNPARGRDLRIPIGKVERLHLILDVVNI